MGVEAFQTGHNRQVVAACAHDAANVPRREVLQPCDVSAYGTVGQLRREIKNTTALSYTYVGNALTGEPFQTTGVISDNITNKQQL